MSELGLYYPLMTFVIAKEGHKKQNQNKNVFTIYINDKHQVVDIIRG